MVLVSGLGLIFSILALCRLAVVRWLGDAIRQPLGHFGDGFAVLFRLRHIARDNDGSCAVSDDTND